MLVCLWTGFVQANVIPAEVRLSSVCNPENGVHCPVYSTVDQWQL